MKVLHISSEKSWRGGEQQIAYLISELSNYCENEVVCRKNSSFEKYCYTHGIKHTSFDFSTLGIIRSAFLLKAISSDVDIIHAHTAKAHSLCYYALLIGMKKNVVVSRRVDFIPKRSRITIAKYRNKYVKAIVCVSDAIRDIMKAYMGASGADKCLTIHSGVDLNKLVSEKCIDLRNEYNLSPESIIIGNTSALADHKDYFTFLNAAALLIKENKHYVFFILGDGPLEMEIKKYCDRKGLNKYVFFTGFIERPIAYLRAFDVFLITSKTEGLGTSIIDAFANSVPVVATKAGGIPELVIHNKTGLLADVGDSEKVRDNVLKVCRDTALSKKLTAGAKTHVQNFTKEKTAEKTKKLYQLIIEMN